MSYFTWVNAKLTRTVLKALKCPFQTGENASFVVSKYMKCNGFVSICLSTCWFCLSA